MRQIAVRTPRVQVISATTGEGVPELLTAVATDLAEPAEDETIRVGFEQGRQRAWLFDRKLVRSETRTDDGFELAVRWTERDRSQFRQME
jgi:GTP-binding protein HflX